MPFLSYIVNKTRHILSPGVFLLGLYSEFLVDCSLLGFAWLTSGVVQFGGHPVASGDFKRTLQ